MGRRHFIRGIGLVVFGVVLAYIDWRAVSGMWRLSHPGAIAGAALLFFPILLMKSIRWRVFLRGSADSIPLSDMLTSNISAHFVGSVTPGRVGEFIRILYLRNRGIPDGPSAGSVILDKLADVIALAGIAFAGAFFSRTALGIGFGEATAFGLLGLAIWAAWKRIQTLERFRSPVRKVRTVLGHAAGFRPSDWINGAGWTIGVWSLCFLQILLLAWALDIALDPGSLLFAYAASSLAGLLPITFAGIGTRDAVLVLLFQSFGESAEAAVAFSLGILLLYVLQTLLSLPFWFTRGARLAAATPDNNCTCAG